MLVEVTDSPNATDEALVIAQVRAYNATCVKKDVRRLCVFARTPDGAIIGGLTGITYWNYLEVSYLWVSEPHRKVGHATRLLQAAEAEAVRRGCRYAHLDTYSFQALPFYQKLGYQEFGRLSGVAGEHHRHYLHKEL